MKTIALTRGYSALVDDADYELVACFKWHANIKYRRDGSVYTVYAMRVYGTRKEKKVAMMHRFILGLSDPKIKADHWNHNGLDNQRSNLRICTQGQNQGNTRMRVSNTSGFKGVSWHALAKKWTVSLGANGNRKYIGLFASKEEAARAYNVAATKLFGEFAVLNEV